MSQTIYDKTLESFLGDEGRAVSDWLSNNTANGEFYDQPMHIQNQDQMLIEHAVNMLDKMIRLSKVLFSKQDNSGAWVYNSPFTKEDMARVSLYHVLGRIGKYVREIRNKKIDGKWVEVEQWVYNENAPVYGTDSAKSILILHEIWQEYGLDPLTREVETALLNIEGVWENPTKSGLYPTIYKQNQLALLTHIAYTMAIFEKKINS